MSEEEKALSDAEEKVRDEMKPASNYKSQKEELYDKLSKIYEYAKFQDLVKGDVSKK
jgi:negative regulator of genetic competence, sporulation and motility